MARRKAIEVWLTATRGEVPGTWRGTLGRINASQIRPLVNGEPTLCFVCGPASMVEAVPRLLLELGVPKERIFIEQW